jgi:hypothetical protein
MQDGQFETFCQGWLDEVEQLVDVVASMTNTQATKFHAELKEKLQIDDGKAQYLSPEHPEFAQTSLRHAGQIQQLDATGTQLASHLASTKTGDRPRP